MRHLLSALLISSAVAFPAFSDEVPVYTIVLKDHMFEPDTLEIPADTKVKLQVKNEDPTPAEFESDDFKREKIIKGGSEAVINVGPLAAGEYKFFDEFNEDTAQGVLVVK